MRLRILLTGAAIVTALAASACTHADVAAPGTPSGSAEVKMPGADQAVAALFPADIRSAGEIQIAADPSYPPSTFKDPSGKIIGISPDVANAVAAKAGLKVKWVEVPFDGMLGGLQAHRFAASWAGWSITKERLQLLNFVTYLQGGTSVLVKPGNPKGVKAAEDLCGLQVAMQTGTTQAQQVLDELQQKCSAAGKARIQDVQLPQQTNVNQAVATGRADALLADNNLVAYQAKIQPGSFEAVPSIFINPATIGIAIPKDNTQLADAIAAAINALIADGTYMSILDRWQVGNAGVPKSEVNPTAAS